jgi:hypothetical protein
VTISPDWTGGSADPPVVGNLEFSWTPAAFNGLGWVDHASHYEIQIGTDPNFSNGTYTMCTTDQTTYTLYQAVTSDGEPGGCNMPASVSIGIPTFYWRVRGIDGPAGINGQWDSTGPSDTQRFVYLPSLPDLLTPTNGADVETPVLSWSAVSGAEQYRVTIKNVHGVQVEQADTYGSRTRLRRSSPPTAPSRGPSRRSTPRATLG